MASTTPNLNLTQPAYSESADVGVLNTNFGLIDAFAGKVLKLTDIDTYSGDCNNITETCTLYVTSSATNSPGSWSLMQTIYYNSDAVAQFALLVTDNVMKIRVKSPTFSGWSGWRTVTFTNNRGYADVTIPVGTPAGAYKVGTFSSLNIPYGSALLCAQCINATGSICPVSGLSTYDQDIYVYVIDTVQVANGTVRITYIL